MTRLLSLTGLVCLSVCLGCGSGGPRSVLVTGEVRHKGELYLPAQGEQVMISFAEEKEGKVSDASYPTRLKPDGTYEVVGPNGKGIPAGKYQVGIESRPEVPVPGKPVEDKFKGAMKLPKSPISVTVSPENSKIPLEIP